MLLLCNGKEATTKKEISSRTIKDILTAKIGDISLLMHTKLHK